MKYDFALDFTPEGVSLLQGSGDDQVVFGTVGFDDPHFDTRVEDLRKEAEEVHGGPFATALLLPHSEVLFHTMKVEEGTEIDEKSVRAELDGMTPYDVDALAFDWKSLSKTQAEIAAVARDTLAEADAFAAAHGFGPGPFSTAPNPKAFRGQPTFGASDRPMPKPAPLPEPEPEPAPIPEAEAPAADLPVPKGPVPLPVAQDDAPAPPPATKEPATAPTAATPPKEPAKADDRKAQHPERPPLIDDLAEPQIKRPAKTETPAPKTDGPAPKPAAATEKSDPTPSFSSRRANGAAEAAAATGVAVAAGAAAGVATAATVSRLGSLASRAASSPDGGAGPSAPSRGPAKEGPKARTGPVPPQRRTTAPAPSEPSGRGAAPGRVGPTPTVRKVDTPDSVSGAAKSLSTSPGAANPKPPLNEAESLTVFGARGSRKSSRTAMLPIVIGLIVAVLLALGVWTAFFFLSDPEDTAPEVEQSSALPIDDATSDDGTITAGTEVGSAESLPVIEDTSADAANEDVAPPAEEPAAEVEPEAPAVDRTAPEEPAPTDTATPDPGQEPGPDDPLRRSQDAPEATRYAATGVSTDAPSSSEIPAADSAELDSGAQGDSTIRVQDGVATLDAPELAALSAPAQLAPPPPPGARFELDENGRVVATPEGTLSPQGVRITAGQPPVVPPQTPDRPAGTAEAEAAPLEESSVDLPVTEGQPSLTPPERPADVTAGATDQAAIGPTPMARPDDIAVTRRAALEDDATSPGSVPLTDLEGPQDTAEGVVQTPSDAQVVLAALSPRARPEREVPQQDLPQISEEQSAAQAEAVATAIASIVPGLEEATDEAVARSLRPGNRPRNFASTVEQTREAAPVQVASAASVVTPRNPTAGSVASHATNQDVIRLNRVNLIGVYGTQSSRRALIRLPSGRFVKVKVGDSVDGGRVSAIASDKLQYVKGGRQVVLTIPAG